MANPIIFWCSDCRKVTVLQSTRICEWSLILSLSECVVRNQLTHWFLNLCCGCCLCFPGDISVHQNLPQKSTLNWTIVIFTEENKHGTSPAGHKNSPLIFVFLWWTTMKNIPPAWPFLLKSYLTALWVYSMGNWLPYMLPEDTSATSELSQIIGNLQQTTAQCRNCSPLTPRHFCFFPVLSWIPC